MSPQTEQIFEFGPFRLDGAEHLLLRDGKLISLTAKAWCWVPSRSIAGKR